MGDRLRLLWDFDDLDGSEQRFREQLEQEVTEGGRGEVLSQLARIEGLRGRFEAGERLLAEAEAVSGFNPVARGRISLERGRLRRSSGDTAGAVPMFASAFDLALEANELTLAADAAHMAALVTPDRDGMVAWTECGIEIAQTSDDPEVRYWLGPLLNNLGWEYYEAEEYEAALAAFERALAERERAPEQRAQIEIARYAVGKTLRASGRTQEAAAMLETCVAWAEAEGRPDGWFHEELAEGYAALGREEEARAQARLALPLLLEGDSSYENEAERLNRLRRLADA